MNNQTNGRHTHTLKILPEYYQAQLLGLKNFEIRKSDRPFQVGDEVWLCEFDPESHQLTGHDLHRVITYITDYAQQPGYVVFGTKGI